MSWNNIIPVEALTPRTFFTSDLHFWHKNIIDFCKRPYGSMEHMNEDLIKRHNMVVQPKDHIWYLGDLSFGTYDQTAEILNQLNGIKHLVVGNHDRKGRSEKLFNRDWEKWFVEKHDYLRLKIGNNKFALCHFPFASWERGYINLHGHLHNLVGYENKYKQYDVGADANNYTPVLMEDVVKKAESGVKAVNFY